MSYDGRTSLRSLCILLRMLAKKAMAPLWKCHITLRVLRGTDRSKRWQKKN